MPTNAEKGIQISTLIFQPNTEREIYSKQILHPDELLYFICGKHQKHGNIKGHKIAFGICYESVQREHFLNANKNGADIYIANVAKSQKGIKNAYSYYSKISKEFKTPLLMVNCVGLCDSFETVGQSAVWNHKGKQIGHLDSHNSGILVYDTLLKTVEKQQNFKNKTTAKNDGFGLTQ